MYAGTVWHARQITKLRDLGKSDLTGASPSTALHSFPAPLSAEFLHPLPYALANAPLNSKQKSLLPLP